MATQNFLITGGTGKQGGAVIQALLTQSSSSSKPIHVLALTRNLESASAKALSSTPNVTVIEGDTTNPSAFFQKAGPIDGVFSVTVPGKEGAEEKQAYDLIDSSVAHGVKHFVFTSVQRGRPDDADQVPTPIGHFVAKHRVEEYLKEKAAAGKMEYTILRPVAFMDNLSPNFLGKGFASMWAGMGDKRLQLVSVKDVGYVGAKALLNLEKYKGQAVGIAGDELSFAEANKVFKDTTGKNLPQTWGFVGAALQWAIADVGTMFSWFKTDGYTVDIPTLKKTYPEIQDFKTWLKESSSFREQ